MAIRSELTECVTILTENKCSLLKTLTYEKFLKSYDTRAKIVPLGYISSKTKIYSVTIPIPPAELSNVPFIGILWNNAEYTFTAPLKPYCRKFLIGNIKPIA